MSSLVACVKKIRDKPQLWPIEHLFAFCHAYHDFCASGVHTIGPLHYLESGIHHSFFNWIYGYPSQLSAEQRETLIKTVGKLPATWVVDVQERDAMKPFLAVLPLAHLAQVQGVAFDLNDIKLPDLKKIDGLEIKRVTTDEEMILFDRISAPCFEYEEGMTLEFMHALPAQKKEQNVIELYLVYLKGKPVGVYQMYTYQGVRGLYWGGVTPYYRNQGIASAVLAHVLEESRQRGCTRFLSQLVPGCLSLVGRFAPHYLDQLDFYVLMPDE
jgi:GNAT superfamily N-acetyltransferase